MDAGLQANYDQSKKLKDDYSPYINLGKTIGYQYKDAPPPGNAKGQMAGHIPRGAYVGSALGTIHTLTMAGACKKEFNKPNCQRYDLNLEIYVPGTTTTLQVVEWAPPTWIIRGLSQAMGKSRAALWK